MTDTRARGWCFTINNPTEEDEDFAYNLAWGAKYVCCGKEVGEQGTPHLQGFVYFENARKFSAVKAMHDQAHWEPMRGTAAQAAEYCKKEGDFFEWGTPPMTQTEKGEEGKLAIQERWQLAREGKFDELPPEHIKTYEYINRKYAAPLKDRDLLDNLWINGPSGCGKSRYVRENFTVFYWKPMSKWWDGYNGEDVIVLDDFAPEHGKYLGYYLKIWADHYVFNAEVKGGMIRARPKTVVVTSQYKLRDCFEETETKDALERRFQIKTYSDLFKTFVNANSLL